MMQVERLTAKQRPVEMKLPPNDKSNDVKCEKCTQLNCSKTPEGILQMVAHINKDHLQAGIGCPFKGCSYRGLAVFDIHRHYSVVHVEKEIKDAENTTCFLCGVRKESQRELVRHTRIVHLKDNEYYCNTCGDFATFSLKDWVNHVNQKHADNPPKIRFHRIEDFVPGMKKMTHRQLEEYSSMQKGLDTGGPIRREKTILTSGHKPKQLAPVQRRVKSEVLHKCFRCPERFASKLCLLQHIKNNHGDVLNGTSKAGDIDQTPAFYYLCTLCDKKASTDEIVHKHIDNTHFKSLSAKCPHCPQFLSSAIDLTLHVQQNHYKHFSLTKFNCGTCDYAHSKFEPMQYHIWKNHGIKTKEMDFNEVMDELRRPEKRKLEELALEKSSNCTNAQNITKVSRLDKIDVPEKDGKSDHDVISSDTECESDTKAEDFEENKTKTPIDSKDLTMNKELIDTNDDVPSYKKTN